MEAEAISALLHLGGVAVVLSIAFLGFDRLDATSEEFNAWLEKEVTQSSQDLLERRLGCKTPAHVEAIGGVLGEWRLRLLFNFVLHLAGRPCIQRLSPRWWWSLMMWLDGFVYAPHLRYFKSTTERRFIAKLTFIGVLLYVVFIGAVIWDTPGVIRETSSHLIMAKHGFFLVATYLYFLSMMLITLYHARTAARLRRLKCNVPLYFEMIHQRITEVHQTLMQAAKSPSIPQPSAAILSSDARSKPSSAEGKVTP